MSPTSKSRKRKRRAQLLAGRPVPVGEAAWPRSDDRTWAQIFDDWMLSRLSTRMAGVLFVLASGIMVVLAIATVNGIDDLRAYDNAPTCDASPTTACRADVPVVITAMDKVVTYGGKSNRTTYYVEVSGLWQQPTTRIQLFDGSGIWGVAHEGDDAVVELWNGAPVSITADDVTSETTDTPRGTMVTEASCTLAALAGAAMFGLYWFRRRAFHRTGGERWPDWLTRLEPMALTATAGLIVGAAVGSAEQSLLATAVIGGGFMLIVGGIPIALERWVKARRT